MFFSGGLGFGVMNGDALVPKADDAWYPLSFEHDDNDGYSSYLTNISANPILRCQREDQIWSRMLLPEIYHGPVTSYGQQGGLKGDLSIFLALVAFSLDPSYMQSYLPSIFHSGRWQAYNTMGGCKHNHTGSTRSDDLLTT